MDQNLAQIDVASLADAQQLGLAAGRVLAWYEAEPRCEVASLAERSAVADGGDDSRRNDGADVWDLPDAAAASVALGDLFEPAGQLIDLLLDGLPLVPSSITGGRHKPYD
jgi:hypothetical protein